MSNTVSTTPAPKVGRVVYLDLMRIISVFFMVMLHVSAYGWDHMEPGSTGWQICNLFNSTTRFCVPVFVMLSGVFFLNPDKEYSLKKLFGVKLLRIITAFLFWSFAYACVTVVPKAKSLGTEEINQIISLTLTGHFHLWFMFMIAGLYLIVPFLRKITTDKKLIEYFLILSAVTIFVVGHLAKTDKLQYIISEILKDSNYGFTLGFVGYFVAGYYFNRYEISRKARTVIYALGAISFVLMTFLTSYLSVKAGKGVGTWLGNLMPTDMLYSLAVFVFFKYEVSKIRFSERAERIIVRLSGLSFGIYLSHIMPKMFFELVLGFSVLSFNPIISVPVVTVAIFTASLLITLPLSKIPLIGKYIT